MEKRKRGHAGKRGGSTARHEARHAVAAILNGTGVESASIIPGPGYLGVTYLSGFDAVAAAAPHAHGDGGTSHDLSIIERAGHSIGAAVSAAKNILSGKNAEVEAVAGALEDAGTLSGGRIREIMNDASARDEVVIQIFFPDGRKEEKKNRKTKDANGVMLTIADIPKEVPRAA